MIKKLREQSYNEFISAMNLDDEQKETVDSIIGSYSKALEGQILVNEKNTIAINQNLWNFRKAIFADLLVASEKLNKTKFDRIVPAGITDDEKVVVVNALEKLKNVSGDQYIFVTPDSIFADSYQFDSEVFEKEMRIIEEQVRINEEKVKEFTLNITYDSNFRKFADAK